MTDRLNVTEMNVAICRALGIDPQGVRSLRVELGRYDEVPRIEVVYSARYIGELIKSMATDDEHNPITSRYTYELVPLPDGTTTPPPNGRHLSYLPGGVVGTTSPPYARYVIPTYPNPSPPPTPSLVRRVWSRIVGRDG